MSKKLGLVIGAYLRAVWRLRLTVTVTVMLIVVTLVARDEVAFHLVTALWVPFLLVLYGIAAAEHLARRRSRQFPWLARIFER